MKTKRALVCGGNRFVGDHLIERLKLEGYWVRSVDIRPPMYPIMADEIVEGVLYDPELWKECLEDVHFDEVYQLLNVMDFWEDQPGEDIEREKEMAFEMSYLLNHELLEACKEYRPGRIFLASSDDIYENRGVEGKIFYCSEDMVDYDGSENEWKCGAISAERMYREAEQESGLNVRIGRIFKTYGPRDTYPGGFEYLIHRLCRDIALSQKPHEIEVIGEKDRLRNFLYIDDCIEGIRRLMASDYSKPLNIGSEKIFSVDEWAEMIAEIAGKSVIRYYTSLSSETSDCCCPDNSLIRKELGWEPNVPVESGLRKTYRWVLGR